MITSLVLRRLEANLKSKALGKKKNPHKVGLEHSNRIDYVYKYLLSKYLRNFEDFYVVMLLFSVADVCRTYKIRSSVLLLKKNKRYF